jgi:hypothetical protein
VPHAQPVRSQLVTLGGAPARQSDPTTCGSTALLMLAATGDPVLAGWLENGELPADLPPHRVPPEIPPGRQATDAAGRMAAAQQHIKGRTGAHALGPLRWPAALGTPPWTAAREARFPGVRYRGFPVDDASPAGAALIAEVQAATLAGIPVPLYTGGDLGGGLAAAVPRHVVLAVPPPHAARHRGHDDAGNRVLHVYDPSGGRVHQVPLTELLGRTVPHPALGGWTHVCWVLLPRPARPSDSLAPSWPAGQAGQTIP